MLSPSSWFIGHVIYLLWACFITCAWSSHLQGKDQVRVYEHSLEPMIIVYMLVSVFSFLLLLFVRRYWGKTRIQAQDWVSGYIALYSD